MLGNIAKIAAMGLLGFGAKKIYDLAKENKEADDDESIPYDVKEWEKRQYEEAQKEPDPTMRMMIAGSPRIFEKESFYQELKEKLPKGSQNWDDEKKNRFMQEMLSKFEGCEGWDYVHAEDDVNIFELSYKKGKTLEMMRFVAEIFPGLEQTARVMYVVNEVERIRERRAHPIYNLEQKPSVEIPDIGFKLAIINHLMFKEKTLKPMFSLPLFKEESKKFIRHNASREAGEYIKNLDIPINLMKNIRRLEIDPYTPLYSQISILRDHEMDTTMFSSKIWPQARFEPLFSELIGNDLFLPISEEEINKNLDLLPNLEEILVKLSSDDKKLGIPEKMELKDVGLNESVINILGKRNIKVTKGSRVYNL